MSEYPFGMRLQDGDITEPEVEAYAQGVYDMLLLLGVQCGHGKSYDPLTIRKPGHASSYVFDLWDGGRGHDYESLEQLVRGILAEAAYTTKRDDLYVDDKAYGWALHKAEELNATPIRIERDAE